MIGSEDGGWNGLVVERYINRLGGSVRRVLDEMKMMKKMLRMILMRLDG